MAFAKVIEVPVWRGGIVPHFLENTNDHQHLN